MNRFLALLSLLLLFLLAPLEAVWEQWEFSDQRKFDSRPRPTSELLRDIQALGSDMRSDVRALRELYVQTGDRLHDQHRREAEQIFEHALKLRREIYERFAELARHERDERFEEILYERFMEDERNLREWAELNASLTPLIHLIRRSRLRPRAVLADRRFFDQKLKEWVSGSDLIEKVRNAWKHWRLRTKTSYLQAKQILQPIVKNVPDFLPAAFWLARVFFDLEQVIEARDLLKGLVRVDPELEIASSLNEQFLSQESLILHSLSASTLTTPEAPVELLPPPRPHPAQQGGVLEVPYVIALGPEEQLHGIELLEGVLEIASKNSSRLFGVLKPVSRMRQHQQMGPAGPLFRAAVEFFAPFDSLFLHQGLTGEAEEILRRLNLPHIGGDRVAGVFSSTIRPQGFDALSLHPVRLQSVAYHHRRSQLRASELFEVDSKEPSWATQSVEEVHVAIDGSRFLSFRLDSQDRQWRAFEDGNLRNGLQEFMTPNLLVLHLNPAMQSRGLQEDPSILTSGEADWFVRGKHFQGRFQQSSLHEPMVLMTGEGEVARLAGHSWYILGCYGDMALETRAGGQR